MDVFESLIQTSTGRDKIVRAAVGVFTLTARAVTRRSPSIGLCLGNAANQLRGACMVLRLLDDVPMYRATCRQWSNKQEKDKMAWLCGVLSSISVQALLPFEHVMWAANQNVLPMKPSTRWSTGIFVCASFASVFTIIRNIRNIFLTIQNGQRLAKEELLESPRPGDGDFNERHELLNANDQVLSAELWSLIKAVADLIVSVNMLPNTTKYRCLWAGKVNRSISALLAAFSAIVGLGIHIATICRR